MLWPEACIARLACTHISNFPVLYLSSLDVTKHQKRHPNESSLLIHSVALLIYQSWVLISSDHDEPGTRISPSIQPLCSIKLKFRADQFETFSVCTNAVGKRYRPIYCTLQMSVSVSSIEWVVTCNGSRVPTVIEYQQTELEAKLPTWEAYENKVVR